MLDLRAQMPVLGQLAYLGAGTSGPLPEPSVAAARAELERELSEGRGFAHFQRRTELSEALRGAYGRLLGAPPEHISLTSCTSEGIAIVIDGLELGPGQEILTSDEEHPGLLGPLAGARENSGVSIRAVPLARIRAEISERTALIACSHVSWMTGALAPDLSGLEIPLLLDGAQAAGAIPVDVGALGASAYAGPGQKWLCGPDGTGLLYVSPDLLERLRVGRRSYCNLAEPDLGLEAGLQADGRRFDSMSLSAETLAGGLASMELLESFGWSELHARAAELARDLVARLGQLGRAVAPRGDSTLVAFQSPDAQAERQRLTERGVILRDIPGHSRLRASVGAWNDERDLERLIEALAG